MTSLRSILSLLAPATCELCSRPLVAGEGLLCADCQGSLTATVAFPPAADSPLRERLPRLGIIDRCGAMLTYRHDSPAAMLIRRGKYDNRPDIIRDLGHIWGERLDASGIMSDIDALQAVPMHLLKRLRRGYNQADILARAIGEACDIPVIHAMGARRHSAQARNTATERLTNAAGIFYVTHPDVIAGRHIAIIDDIITTGATLSDAIRALANARPRAITVITLAAATL